MFESVRAPILCAVDRVPIVELLNKRTLYLAVITKYNIANTASIVPRSLDSSSERDVLDATCELELEIDMDRVDDGVLQMHLDEKLDALAPGTNFQHIQETMAADLKMHLTIRDPTTRVLRLCMTHESTVSRHAFRQFFSRGANKKRTSQFIISALRPSRLAVLVENEARYECSLLKTNVPRLLERTTEPAIDFQQFTAPAIADEPQQQASCHDHGNAGRNHVTPIHVRPGASVKSEPLSIRKACFLYFEARRLRSRPWPYAQRRAAGTHRHRPHACTAAERTT